jgi:hypothetical protein
MVRRDEMRAHVTLRISYSVDPLNYPEGSDITLSRVIDYEKQWWNDDPTAMLDHVLDSDAELSFSVEVEVK